MQYTFWDLNNHFADAIQCTNTLCSEVSFIVSRYKENPKLVTLLIVAWKTLGYSLYIATDIDGVLLKLVSKIIFDVLMAPACPDANTVVVPTFKLLLYSSLPQMPLRIW